VRKLRDGGEQVNDDDLRYQSPLLRHHIGIYGQYNFDFRRAWGGADNVIRGMVIRERLKYSDCV
jgi:hypothetical protein